MDIGKSFNYVFEDPRWIVKIAIGGAIVLAGAVSSVAPPLAPTTPPPMAPTLPA
jgi:hypothetical protein